MNKTAELVKLWAEFEEAHPNADIADFCRFTLIKERQEKDDKDFLGGVIPPGPHSKIAKLTGRIAKLHMTLSLPVLRNCGINNFEDFMFLNSIYKLKEPNKTEVINSNFVELSSGLLILERLKKNGLVTEKNDLQDKRSKKLSITAKGRKVSEKAYKKMLELNELSFGGMRDEDILLCIQLMSPVESKLAALWLESKGKLLP